LTAQGAAKEDSSSADAQVRGAVPGGDSTMETIEGANSGLKEIKAAHE
jgi:hypothetical protein